MMKIFTFGRNNCNRRSHTRHFSTKTDRFEKSKSEIRLPSMFRNLVYVSPKLAIFALQKLSNRPPNYLPICHFPRKKNMKTTCSTGLIAQSLLHSDCIHKYMYFLYLLVGNKHRICQQTMAPMDQGHSSIRIQIHNVF